MKKIAILMPCYNNLPAQTFLDFVDLLVHAKQKFEVSTLLIDSTVIAEARNILAREFLKTDAEYALWLDSDMSFPEDIIEKMMEEEKDFVSALSFTKRVKIEPSFRVKTAGAYNAVEDYPKNSVFEVDAVGLACALMKRKVLEQAAKISGGKPLFGFSQPEVGEDVWFCELVKQAGFKIFVSSKIIAGHVGGIVDEQVFDAKRKK